MDDFVVACLKKFIFEVCEGHAVIEESTLDKYDDYELVIEEVPDKEDSTRFLLLLTVLTKAEYKKLACPEQKENFTN